MSFKSYWIITFALWSGCLAASIYNGNQKNQPKQGSSISTISPNFLINNKRSLEYLPPQSSFSFSAIDKSRYQLSSLPQQLPPYSPYSQKRKIPPVSFGTLSSAPTINNNNNNNNNNNYKQQKLSTNFQTSSPTYEYSNSYAPQPSGISKLKIPSPPTLAPLPSLQPNSVYNQIASTLTATTPKENGTFASDDNPLKTSSLFFDTSMKILTPAQNATILAAKLLADSLIEVSTAGDANGDNMTFIEVDPTTLNENNLNNTEVVVLKAQKNAYIIPMKLQTSESNQTAIQELYNMKNKLERAYTINQFLFIIKPQHINFLNKLV